MKVPIKVDIYFDGACKNVKGSRTEPTGCGVAVFINKEYSEEFSKGFAGDPGTSNIAEWRACVEAMEIANDIQTLLAVEGDRANIDIYSDSQIVTRQYNGKYQISEVTFLNYFRKAKYFGDKAQVGSIRWIKREFNQKADELSKKGLQVARNIV